jgi:hypothetical protein
MDERYETAAPGITLPVEPVVIVDEPGEQLGQKRLTLRTTKRLSDVPDGDPREGRLRDA